jgi:hypothetical protein
MVARVRLGLLDLFGSGMEVDVDHQLIENAAGGFGGTRQIDARRRTIIVVGHEAPPLLGKASGVESYLPPLAAWTLFIRMSYTLNSETQRSCTAVL